MRILISGAGIAGPTLAWYLAKAGARITIVEKNHSPPPWAEHRYQRQCTYSNQEDGAHRSDPTIQHNGKGYPIY